MATIGFMRSLPGNKLAPRRTASCESGVTLVESTLAIPFLLIFLIISFELLKLSYYQLTLQFSLSRVARLHAVNPTLDIRDSLDLMLRRFGVALTDGDRITVCPRHRQCSPNAIDHGSPRDAMLYRIDRRIRIFFLSPSGDFDSGTTRASFNLSATVLGRNEP